MPCHLALLTSLPFVVVVVVRPELLPFLQQCFQSANEEHREIALVVLGYLTEAIGESMPQALATVRDVSELHRSCCFSSVLVVDMHVLSLILLVVACSSLYKACKIKVAGYRSPQ